MNADIPLDGYCDPHFMPVRDALADNMRKGEEVGACVAVYVDGKPMVDLWAGYRDRARTLLWERDTLVCMMSVTKAVGALCVLMLADRGRIELDVPVALVHLSEIMDFPHIPELHEDARQAQCLQLIGAAMREESAAA